jgi:hypothetical protein
MEKINIISDKKKDLLFCEYITNFKYFYLSRDLTQLTYNPVFYCIFNNKRSLVEYKKLMKKYFTINEKTETKEMHILDYSFEDFEKKFYIITLEEEYKDECDLYIKTSDINESDIIIVLNEFFLKLREKVSGYTLILNEKTFEKFFNLSVRTYSDVVFLDSNVQSAFENFSKLFAAPINFQVNFKFENKFFCIDRTTNWTEFKVYKF